MGATVRLGAAEQRPGVGDVATRQVHLRPVDPGAREEQWRGIVYSDVIFAVGFAIFALSNFPPTQRFGLVILFGLVIDILANLLVLPLLGGAELKKRD